jgi:hypothetical protein
VPALQITSGTNLALDTQSLLIRAILLELKVAHRIMERFSD